MTPTLLQKWVLHPEMLNRDTLYELRTLVARYPYFQSIRLLYLKNLYLLHDLSFGAELRNSALYIADRRVLFYLIEGDRYILQPLVSGKNLDETVGQELGLDRTLSLIDAFLSTIPDEHAQNTTELDYGTDYISYLMQESEDKTGEVIVGTQAEDVPKLRGQELIDGFIHRSEAGEDTNFCLDRDVGDKQNSDAKRSPEEKIDLSGEDQLEKQEEDSKKKDEPSPSFSDELDDSYFTETLAKIYIKQKRYDKALEIIKKLSLNYPKKNAYFADQIRFLEKLIINAKSK
ncbi:MAG: tetratricopeptide repeat protein [Bacteroides sp.]|jgi:hypothetical protein|nr:tetratricopeptide repeat protein [Bacteroides sp.]MCI1683340.1 tetratricopeptide repeat protein [Bacteroides sp.]